MSKLQLNPLPKFALQAFGPAVAASSLFSGSLQPLLRALLYEPLTSLGNQQSAPGVCSKAQTHLS